MAKAHRKFVLARELQMMIQAIEHSSRYFEVMEGTARSNLPGEATVKFSYAYGDGDNVAFTIQLTLSEEWAEDQGFDSIHISASVGQSEYTALAFKGDDLIQIGMLKGNTIEWYPPIPL